MDQSDGASQLRILEEMATPESASHSPWKRAPGSIILGPLTTLILAIGVALVVSGCSTVGEMIKARTMGSIDGLCAEFQVLATDESQVTPEVLEQTRVIIENRINATGVAEPVVLSREPDGMVVALPGIDPGSADADHIFGLIGTTGVLEFIPVPLSLQNAPLQNLPLPDEMLDVEPLFNGTEIAAARIGQDPQTNQIIVNLELKETGARLFDEHAEAHYRERFAIVLDGVVESAPSINATRFGGQAVISGDFTVEEATNLVTVLKFGSLPLEIREVGARACGGASPQADAGRRVEVPEVSVALTYPSDWEVEVAPWDTYRPERHLVGRLQVMAHDADGDASCDLYTQRRIDGSDLSLDDETEAFVQSVEADPDTELLPTTQTRVLLPDTDASRVDFESHGSSYSYWHVADGPNLHQLACSAAKPPHDHWRSIARTLESIAVEP